jgi:hypothetical protein
VRTWALDQFANITGRYQPVEVQEAAFVGEDAEPEGFAAAFATDGQPGRAWAVGWDAERVVVDEPCAAAEGAASGALSVSFTQDTKVDRITVRAGLDRNNQQWSKQARPRTIDVRFSDGSCKRLDLKDEFGAQRFSVQAAAANGAIVTIVDAYPQHDGPGGLVALSEITFEARR